jgi:glycerol-3-phosphate dehydrogenase
MRSYDGREPDVDVDVAIVGGGINGTGVARDLALRGLSVVLFERNDLAFGASGNNSGMIHGGVRYLKTNPSVTESSCRDSGYIQKIAPFLLRIRSAPGARRKGPDHVRAHRRVLSRVRRLPAAQTRREARAADASDLARLEPGLVGSYVGGITFDEASTRPA